MRFRQEGGAMDLQDPRPALLCSKYGRDGRQRGLEHHGSGFLINTSEFRVYLFMGLSRRVLGLQLQQFQPTQVHAISGHSSALPQKLYS